MPPSRIPSGQPIFGRAPGAVGPRPPAIGLGANIDPMRVLRRYLPLILASVVVGAALGTTAFVALDRTWPLYREQVLFEIQPGVRDSREIGASDIGSDQLAMRLGNTEAALLTNREVLLAAMRSPNVRTTTWHRQFMDGSGTFVPDLAVDSLEKTLTAGVIRGTNFFRLTWRAPHAADVPVVLNAIADAYIERRREIEDSVWNVNVRMFDDHLGRSRRDLEAQEQEIRQFIQNRGLTTLDSPRHSQVAIAAEQLTTQIGHVSSALNMMETSLMQTTAKLVGTIEFTPEDRLEAERDPSVAAQIRRITDINTELRDRRERFDPRHQAVRELERMLRAAENERDDRIQEVIRQNLEARARQLQNEIERYSRMLDEFQSEADAKDAVLRELAASQAEYQAMESKRNRLESDRDLDMAVLKDIHMIRMRADASRVRLAQRALLPRRKAFPRWEVIIPLGTLVTVGLTIGAIFLREMTDRRIKAPGDIAVLPGGRVLGVVPDLDEDPTISRADGAELVVRHHPRSVLAESYRQVCALISRKMEQSGHQTLLLLGGLPGAGTTTVASNIACSLAASGKNVLLVDANFRRPRLAQVMGVDPNAPGLGDLLVGNAMPMDVLQLSSRRVDLRSRGAEAEGDSAGISVISAGTPANRVFERLNNGRFESVVAELRSRFDVVVFDAPPAVVAGDALVLANRVDAAVLVVRASQEQRGLVARIIHQLADARCEPLGVVLNGARGTAGGYFRKNYETMAEYSAP
jgi:polysaccharide biosynthesis transport protein